MSSGSDSFSLVCFWWTALVRRGIIKIRKADADLLDLTVTIDRRILDWVVGLDTEISELVEGSNLYTPKV